MPEYQVMAQATPDGKPLVLRRGFPSRNAALDHRVKLCLWHKVWVAKRPLTHNATLDTAAEM